jgi:hypothetical protein
MQAVPQGAKGLGEGRAALHVQGRAVPQHRAPLTEGCWQQPLPISGGCWTEVK